MHNKPINTVLVGKDNSLNRTIFKILQEQDNIEIQLWPVNLMEVKLKEHADGSIDVLIADLRSFLTNVLEVVKYLSEQEAVKAILAIHVYRSLKPVEKLIEAGVTGYLTQDTNERQILNAVECLHKGKKYIETKENTGLGENTYK